MKYAGRCEDDFNVRAKVEEFLAGGLEAWRAAEGHERLVLCGHSLGSYVAVCYAERHPERVQQLVLTVAAR